MRRSPERKTNTINRLAVGSVAVAIAAGGGEASAKSPDRVPGKPTRAQVEKRANYDLRHHKAFQWFKGAAIIATNEHTGGTPYDNQKHGGSAYPDDRLYKERFIKNPLLLDLDGKPQAFGPNQLTHNGVFALGEIIRKAGKQPRIRVYEIDPATTTMLYRETPQKDGPIGTVAFEYNTAGMPLVSKPLTADDDRPDRYGGPLMDQWNPDQREQIALRVVLNLEP